jgi:hypothetical protein
MIKLVLRDDDNPKKVENQSQRFHQAAMRANEWVDAADVSLKTGEPIKTPPMAATKSARRAWQRAKAGGAGAGQDGHDGQPAASPRCRSRSNHEEPETTRRGNSKQWYAGYSASQQYTADDWAAWQETQWYVGSPSNVDARDEFEGYAKGSSAGRQINTPRLILDDWPKQIEIYSHDRHPDCCWNKYCKPEDERRCLRIDVRAFYDPHNHEHDGRHQAVQKQLLCTDHTQCAPKRFIEICRQVRKHLRAHAGGKCVITFWCNRGKHRSVGCAELFNAILSTERWAMAMAGPEGAKVILEHISLDVHKHGCKHGCNECQPKSPYLNPNLLGARAVWDRSEPAL